MTMKHVRRIVALGASLGMLVACGNNSPTTPVVPAAAITAVGGGALTIHPSVDARFCCALETPIHITETAGGTATWNYARISIFKNGVEIERFEVGADTLHTLGFSSIAARSDQTRTVYFRINSQDFEDLTITLGFSDNKDGRAFTTNVAGETFSDVLISLTPASVGGSTRLDG